MTREIKFNKVQDVYAFTNEASKCKGNVYVESHNKEYKINGKSIIGIFSLDLSKPVFVTYDNSEKDFSEFLNKFSK